MVTINVSEGKPYYSQRNNKIRPGSACNVESASSFLLCNEDKIPFFPKDTQLGDFLMATLLGKEGYEKMFEVADTLYPEYAPNEIHSCLEWAINRITGKQTAKFRTDWSLQTLVYSLVKGKAVIVSGRFGTLNHIVNLVGVTTTQDNVMEATSPEDIDLSKIKKFIIDDPWGDPNTNYVEKWEGNDIELSYKQFIQTLKPLGKEIKWGHIHTSILEKI